MSNKEPFVSLDCIKVGSTLGFHGANSGVVIDVMSKVMSHEPIVKGGNEHYLASARFHVDHGSGVESYHTFRYDGVSHHHHHHDIVFIENR